VPWSSEAARRPVRWTPYRTPTEQMAQYRFVTRWNVDAPPDRVFDALIRVEEWPRWWRGVQRVEQVEAGDERGVGTVHRFTFRSRLPYSLAFDVRTTRIEPPHRLEGAATGELEGTGSWTLRDGDGRTHLEYVWDVRTTRWWMNALAPLARRAFAWNHDLVMDWGRAGLARRLAAAVGREPDG
jgi:uncharacterized protein YndB with AHSA1/START domain